LVAERKPQSRRTGQAKPRRQTENNYEKIQRPSLPAHLYSMSGLPQRHTDHHQNWKAALHMARLPKSNPDRPHRRTKLRLAGRKGRRPQTRDAEPQGVKALVSAQCSASPEEWWTKFASLLAQKMEAGCVQSVRIEKKPNGKFEFEVTPTGWPNESS